jgi:SpoVK/Ycf46/Vps4 family AAA+-type ATPase
MGFVQYLRFGSGYRAIGATTKELASGYYDIAHENNALVYVQKSLSTDALLRLADTKSDEVIAEIERFWTLRDRFAKFGLVHKRGFLLFGPPGSGKTSTIAVVANRVIADGGLIINGTSCSPTQLKQALGDLRQVEPNRPLLVTFEDIDSFLKQNEPIVLSILDGDASIANVVFIATTNHPERLEARIINRPSRFDQVVKIGMPSAEARRQYILHCDPSATAAEIDSWLALSDDFSVAQLKELIVGVRCFGHVADDVAERLRSTALNTERKNAKEKRNRTFFEKFHDLASSALPPEQIKKLRDEAAAAVGRNGAAS